MRAAGVALPCGRPWRESYVAAATVAAPGGSVDGHGWLMIARSGDWADRGRGSAAESRRQTPPHARPPTPTHPPTHPPPRRPALQHTHPLSQYIAYRDTCIEINAMRGRPKPSVPTSVSNFVREKMMFVVVFSGRETCPCKTPRDFGRIQKCPLRPPQFETPRFPRAIHESQSGLWTEGIQSRSWPRRA